MEQEADVLKQTAKQQNATTITSSKVTGCGPCRWEQHSFLLFPSVLQELFKNKTGNSRTGRVELELTRWRWSVYSGSISPGWWLSDVWEHHSGHQQSDVLRRKGIGTVDGILAQTWLPPAQSPPFYTRALWVEGCCSRLDNRPQKQSGWNGSHP